MPEKKAACVQKSLKRIYQLSKLRRAKSAKKLAAAAVDDEDATDETSESNLFDSCTNVYVICATFSCV
jgi:hypothetical protein